uniref:Uncharacterized protein n=1 Tax=Setaria viridis TaxID=4556 RepID=A0A4U6T4R5_SETVI|nr:hypothetical protein SEVIR_9G445966v2 [Setaria viridis]
MKAYLLLLMLCRATTIFVGLNFREEKEEKQASKEHIVQIGSMAVGITI